MYAPSELIDCKVITLSSASLKARVGVAPVSPLSPLGPLI